MKKYIAVLLTLFCLVSCARKEVIFELNASPPIQVSCADNAIQTMKEFDYVKVNENSIDFGNKNVVGSLYHGGAVSFGNFGIELSASALLGPNLEKISNKMVGTIYEKCRDNA